MIKLTKADIQAALIVQPKPQVAAALRDCIHFYPSGQLMLTDGSLMIVRRLATAPDQGFSVPVAALAAFKPEREVGIKTRYPSQCLAGYPNHNPQPGQLAGITNWR